MDGFEAEWADCATLARGVFWPTTMRQPRPSSGHDVTGELDSVWLLLAPESAVVGSERANPDP